MTTAFLFDKDYRNLDQVAEFFPAYVAVYDEVVAKAGYPYNDEFKGKIPGIEGPYEDTAIYLLQGMRSQIELFNDLCALANEGFVPLDRSELSRTPRRYASVACWGFYMGGTGLQRIDDVRLLFARDDESLLPEQRTVGILRPRKRTHGHIAEGTVWVKA